MKWPFKRCRIVGIKLDHWNMARKEYRLLPERKTAYELEENCCYEMAVYEGVNFSVAARTGHHNEVIGTLLCDIFDPKLLLQTISRAEYDAIREDVNRKCAAATFRVRSRHPLTFCWVPFSFPKPTFYLVYYRLMRPEHKFIARTSCSHR